jgi:hypothetical protein
MERIGYNRHSRARAAETLKGASRCDAGRAGAHLPSEVLHSTRSSGRADADRAGARPYRATLAKTRRDVQRRITQERVPTASKAGSRDVTWAGVRRSVRRAVEPKNRR